jgi:hypothetical protein
LRAVVAFDDDQVDGRYRGTLSAMAAWYSGEFQQSSAAWYVGNSITTLRLRLVPSGFSKLPARTRKRAPNFLNGSAFAAM